MILVDNNSVLVLFHESASCLLMKFLWHPTPILTTNIMIKARDELGGDHGLRGGDPNYKKIGFYEDQKYKFSTPKAPKILKK